MKEYMKPELELVDFNTEAVTILGTGSGEEGEEF